MAVVNYGKAITSNFMTSVNIQHKEKKYGTKYWKILQNVFFSDNKFANQSQLLFSQ